MIKPDQRAGIFVYRGTVLEAHVLGRWREGKPVEMFGRRWSVDRMVERDGAGLAILLPEPHDFELGPLMCSQCGAFGRDRPGGHGDPFECTSCPNRGYGNGITF